MFHLDALVNNCFETRSFRFVGGFEVDDTELSPNGFGADFDGLVDDARDFGCGAEDVDDIDGKWNG